MSLGWLLNGSWMELQMDVCDDRTFAYVLSEN
jgi:hypothetical protein